MKYIKCKQCNGTGVNNDKKFTNCKKCKGKGAYKVHGSARANNARGINANIYSSLHNGEIDELSGVRFFQTSATQLTATDRLTVQDVSHAVDILTFNDEYGF
jgi:hypothetical protein